MKHILNLETYYTILSLLKIIRRRFKILVIVCHSLPKIKLALTVRIIKKITDADMQSLRLSRVPASLARNFVI